MEETGRHTSHSRQRLADGINWSIKTLVPAKIYLGQGNSRTLTLTLNRDDLSFIGADNKPQVEPRDFDVIVVGLSQKFTLR
jgi:hypothetical protein